MATPQRMSLAERARAVPPELRTAGIASLALALSMVLPWYEKSYFAVIAGHPQPAQANLSAFGVFSFVEAAVLLVAAGVLVLVWARAGRQAFHLPGGDGAVITAAGAWALLLLVWRLFDKPGVQGAATMGVQWGIFAAMVAAGALVAAGARVRAVHRPEPPNPVADDLDFAAPSRRPRPADRGDRRPRDAAAVTDVLRERPAWEGDPPLAPERAEAPAAPDPQPGRSRPRRRGGAGDPPAHDRLF